MTSEDARYRQSSQYRLWSFSPAQLAGMREKANELASASICERLSGPTPRPANVSAPTWSANTPDPDGQQQAPEFLTAAEEELLLTFYTSELIRAANHLDGFTDEIKATAAIFFRRFYVTNSIMTYPPTDMLVVALFFGAKAEGDFRRVGEFCHSFGKDKPEDILAGEFLLCQGIRFAFDVKHPFRALKGAGMELRRYGDIETQRIELAEKRSRDILRFSPLMTDAYFHYTPSQIMLAALSIADRGLAERLMHETFHFVTPPSETSGQSTPAQGGADTIRDHRATKDNDLAALVGPAMRDKVMAVIEACRDMLSEELPERREHYTNKSVIKMQIKPLVRKLAKCRDPDRCNLVELQRLRREEASRKGESDDEGTDPGCEEVAAGHAKGRQEKRRKVNKGLEDPFGGPL